MDYYSDTFDTTTPLLGEVFLVAFDFAPRGYLACWGQLISISQNSALFSLMGTAFGGNGTSTFGIPDLRGRSPVHASGTLGNNTRAYLLGSTAGAENGTLAIGNLPSHKHFILAENFAGNFSSAAGTAPAPGPVMFNSNLQTYATSVNVTMSNNAIAPTGSGTSFPILQPCLALHYIIAATGDFPVRS